MVEGSNPSGIANYMKGNIMKQFNEGDEVVLLRQHNMADPESIEVLEITTVSVVAGDRFFIHGKSFAFNKDGNPLFSKAVMGNVFVRHYDTAFKDMITQSKEMKYMKYVLKELGNMMKQADDEEVIELYSMLPANMKNLIADPL